MSFVSEKKSSHTKLLLLSFLACLIGCQPSIPIDSEIDSSLLVYCSEGSPVSLNPQTNTSGTTVDATAPTLFNQLLDYIPGTTELRPSIAAEWSINDKGTIYRFTLRDDIAFHSNEHFTPSRNLNADDVIFSYNRQRLVNHPLHNINGNSYPYFNGQGLAKLIKRIEKIDQHQVEIELTRPESPFLSILATPFLPIQSKEYAETLMNKNQLELYDKNPIGTGPFQYLAYEADSYLRFIRFDKHFAFKTSVEHLVYSITPDPAMRFARFSAGECDIMRYPLPVHNKLATQDNTIETIQTPALNVAYWGFNTQKPPFNEPKVRHALNFAVNRKAIARAVYDNQAILAEGPLGPSSWAFAASQDKIIYNPEKARQLLQEAGYGEGFNLDIWAMPVQRAYNPNARKMAEMIQQDLLEIGITSNIVSYQWGTFLNRVAAGQHQTVLLGWSADNADPDNFLTPLLSCAASNNGSNYSRWCHPEFDKIILKARQESDIEKRKLYYQQAQEILHFEKPWLPIAHTPNNLLIKNTVKDVNLSPLGTINFEGVTLISKEDAF